MFFEQKDGGLREGCLFEISVWPIFVLWVFWCMSSRLHDQSVCRCTSNCFVQDFDMTMPPPVGISDSIASLLTVHVGLCAHVGFADISCIHSEIRCAPTGAQVWSVFSCNFPY